MLRFRLRQLIAQMEVEQGRSISLDELARETGVSKQVLAKIGDPRGYVTSTRHIEDLCRYFNVLPSNFIVFDPPFGTPRFGETPPPPSESSDSVDETEST